MIQRNVYDSRDISVPFCETVLPAAALLPPAANCDLGLENGRIVTGTLPCLFPSV